MLGGVLGIPAREPPAGIIPASGFPAGHAGRNACAGVGIACGLTWLVIITYVSADDTLIHLLFNPY